MFLYDAVLHVPLVIRLPGRASAGTRVTTQVRLADVAPSVLDAAGLVVPASMQGESLMPLFRHEHDTVGTRAASRPATANRSTANNRGSARLRGN